MDRVEFGVERKAIVPVVNGVDFRDLLAKMDDNYALARADDMLLGVPAAPGFPRGLYYGAPDYADSPFDPRVAIIHSRYHNVTLWVIVRIAVSADEVRWDDFDNPRVSGYPWHRFSLPPLAFERAQYDAALDEVARAFGRP